MTGLQWFKIAQDGLESDGTWATDKMIANKGKVTFTVPSCVEDGQYLLRHEIIALHLATNIGGAEFYPACTQVSVGGDQTGVPNATVSFPGAYSDTDPGIYDPTVRVSRVPILGSPHRRHRHRY